MASNILSCSRDPKALKLGLKKEAVRRDCKQNHDRARLSVFELLFYHGLSLGSPLNHVSVVISQPTGA